MSYIIKGIPSTFIDEKSQHLITIEHEHNMIHDGKAYKSYYYITVPANSIYYFSVPIGDKYINMKERSITSDSANIKYTVLENPATVTAGTIPIVTYNCDRNSVNTSSLIFYANASGVTGGTAIDSVFIPGDEGGQGTNSFSTGGNSGDVIEWILKKNTTYVVKIENNGSVNSNMLLKYFWYEK